VRIVNNGPATLTNKKVRISGSYTRSTLTTPPTAQGANIPAAEYTLGNLPPGQQQNINLGWQINLNQYSYQFTVNVAAVDFTDPNTGNNSYTESFQGAAPQPSAGDVVLTNRTGVPICYVYISPSSDPSWGSDQLSAAETVAHGQSRTWQAIPAGTYDLKAEDCSNNVLGQRTGQNISGTYDWTILANLVLHNNTGQTVCFVYYSLSSDPSWGNDQLGADVVPAGQTYLWKVQSGTYDVKAEDCSNTVLGQTMSVSVAGTYDWYIP